MLFTVFLCLFALFRFWTELKLQPIGSSLYVHVGSGKWLFKKVDNVILFRLHLYLDSLIMQIKLIVLDGIIISLLLT